ncbi:hypothetical protein FRC17_005226 [Serendipita sp. 399]|nr:hypothetical protein FRC17_005226 [Serendipita sp. 399]
MAEEEEEVAVKDEDNDLQQFPSSSSLVTTQTFSGLIARFAYATRSRKGGDSPSQKSSSLQQERSQTNASILNSKLKSSTPKRKRTKREGEYEAGATNVSTPEHSPSNKKRKIRDISHLPPLVDRLDMYLDGWSISSYFNRHH